MALAHSRSTSCDSFGTQCRYESSPDILNISGIDSISLNPDTVVKTTLQVLDVEKKLKAS